MPRFETAAVDKCTSKPRGEFGLGGALGAKLLAMMVRERWVERDLDSRAQGITQTGQRQFKENFDITMCKRLFKVC